MLENVAPDGGPYADTLRVRLPDNARMRWELQEYCEEQGPHDVPPGDFRMEILVSRADRRRNSSDADRCRISSALLLRGCAFIPAPAYWQSVGAGGGLNEHHPAAPNGRVIVNGRKRCADSRRLGRGCGGLARWLDHGLERPPRWRGNHG